MEDELDIQMVARLALEEIGGFEVEVCSSGIEALERARRLIARDASSPFYRGLQAWALSGLGQHRQSVAAMPRRRVEGADDDILQSRGDDRVRAGASAPMCLARLHGNIKRCLRTGRAA